jgi:hypothetical protein
VVVVFAVLGTVLGVVLLGHDVAVAVDEERVLHGDGVRVLHGGCAARLLCGFITVRPRSTRRSTTGPSGHPVTIAEVFPATPTCL